MLKPASTLDITARAARHRVRPDGSLAAAPGTVWTVALRRGCTVGVAVWMCCGRMVRGNGKRLAAQAQPPSRPLGDRLIAWLLLATFSTLSVLGPALGPLHLAADHAVGLVVSRCETPRCLETSRGPSRSVLRRTDPPLGLAAGTDHRLAHALGVSAADCTICHYFAQRSSDMANPVVLTEAGTAQALVVPGVSQTTTKTVISYWIRGPPPGGSEIIAS